MNTGSARARFDGAWGSRLVGPDDGERVDLGMLGVRFTIWSAESGGGFSLVEHPIPPRRLCAPLQRHARENEYRYVLEGRVGAHLGDDVVHAGVGELVFKPRGQWHASWNPGDGPCRILEIISPGGFERFFAELGPGAASPDAARHGLDSSSRASRAFCAAHGLTFTLPAQ